MPQSLALKPSVNQLTIITKTDCNYIYNECAIEQRSTRLKGSRAHFLRWLR